jgi:hypothetical protein
VDHVAAETIDAMSVHELRELIEPHTPAPLLRALIQKDEMAARLRKLRDEAALEAGDAASK